MGAVKEQLRTRHLPELGEVVEMLAARCLELCHELLPRGTLVEKRYWRCGSVAGEPGQSLCVWISGPQQGEWCDFAANEGGDMLNLVNAVLFGGNAKRGWNWAVSWLGLDGQDPARLQTTRRAVVEKARKAVDPDQDDRRKRGDAFRMWMGAWERLAGTPVERYLVGRGIDLAELGRQPRSLRYVPRLHNAESGESWPAMVAAVFDHEGNFLAVHRTWLQVQDDGRVTKAPLVEPKMTLGRYKGGFVALWRGASGKPLKDAPAGEILDVTEGIEDGLSVAVACPESRVFAGINHHNIANIVVPAGIIGLRIWQQNDAPGSDAAIALEKVKAKVLAKGKRVFVARVPAGWKDVNEYLVFLRQREEERAALDRWAEDGGAHWGEA